LESADVELLYDTAVAGVARRGHVHEILVLLAVGNADLWVILNNEVVIDWLRDGERRGSCRLGLGAQRKPG
jgi:hypothetical protein